MGPKEKVEDVVSRLMQPVVEAAGLELVDVEYLKEGRAWFLRVYIDREGGVDLDACELVSGLIAPLLDEDELIPHSYRLEVSSPGLNRPLKREKDFERFRGERVKVQTFAPFDGTRSLVGTLQGFKGGCVCLNVDGAELSVPWEKIASTRLHPEW